MLTRTDAFRRTGAVVAVALGLALLASGCGGDDEARSKERPAVPVNVSVLIGPERITASPDELGAGPVTFLIANQSGASQTLTIDGPRLQRTAGPIPPQDTATIKVDVQTGDYNISADEAAGVKPATLTVGPPRDSAQNQLLLP
jgi:hypothetical protein